MSQPSIRLLDADGVAITLSLQDNGSVQLYEQDLSPSASVFGSDEVERWLTIKPEGKDRLILALLQQAYQGDSHTFSKLRDLFDKHKIPYESFTQ